jgi:fructose-1,6-bisphosphatase I
MVGVNGSNGSETEGVNTNIVTLTRFLTEEQVKHKEATGDFTYVTLELFPPRPR